MPAKRLPMRKVKDVLRSRCGLGLTTRQAFATLRSGVRVSYRPPFYLLIFQPLTLILLYSLSYGSTMPISVRKPL
jgi:hypothetical protein